MLHETMLVWIVSGQLQTLNSDFTTNTPIRLSILYEQKQKYIRPVDANTIRNNFCSTIFQNFECYITRLGLRLFQKYRS
jgi:hypothetical protein